MRFLWFVLVSVFVVCIDRITKLVFTGSSFPVVDGMFHINYIKNSGTFFGIIQSYQLFLLTIILSFLAFFIFLYLGIFYKEFLLQIATGFLFGGITGNLIDRLFLGYVIDFLDFMVWPVFNIADASIVAGFFLLIIYFFKNR